MPFRENGALPCCLADHSPSFSLSDLLSSLIPERINPRDRRFKASNQPIKTADKEQPGDLLSGNCSSRGGSRRTICESLIISSRDYFFFSLCEESKRA